MSDPTRLDPVALDRHITGNYGEDQFADLLDELEDEEDEYTSCEHPGRHGCGYCDACEHWGDDMYDASREDY